MLKTSQKSLSIVLLTALIGLPQLSETIYTPALPAIVHNLATTAPMVEATLAIYFLGFAVGVLLWGTISDWIGRRKAMLSGLLVYIVGTMACAQVEDVHSLLAWRFLQAYGASVGSVITQTILRDTFKGIERAKLFAIMSGALALSPALGPFIGGSVTEFAGWRANFWLLAGLSSTLILWSFWSLPETRPTYIKRITRDQLISLIHKMFSSRAFWGHVLLIGATNGILFGFYQEAPFIFIEQLGMKPSHYGLFGLLISAATLLAGYVSYWQSYKFTSQQFIRWGALSVTGGGSVYTAVTLSGEASLIVPLSALFLVFFGIGLVIPNSLSNALKDYQEAVGTAGSIFGGCYYCLIALLMWLMSFVHNGSALPLPLYIAALGLVLLWANRLVHCTFRGALTTS